MAKMSTDELIDQFKDLTLMELSELVKKFEETFDVTAAAPVAVAAAAGGAAAEEAEEQTEFDVVLTLDHRPRPQGGQGPRRVRSRPRPGGCREGRRRGGEVQDRGRRRFRRAQVTTAPGRCPTAHARVATVLT